MIKGLKKRIILLSAALAITQTSGCAIHKARAQDPERVGEVVPCSARVAIKITETIPAAHVPKRIIEVGAGSGALTPKIINKMHASDHLDLIEIEPILCAELKEKFGHLKNVTIQCLDFLLWKPTYQYDYIVSTLPFNSFPPELVKKLIDHLIAVAKDDAKLGFVEFKWLSSFREMGMKKIDKEQFQKTKKLIHDFHNTYKVYDTDVYMNFPPLVVYHLKIDKDKTQESGFSPQ